MSYTSLTLLAAKKKKQNTGCWCLKCSSVFKFLQNITMHKIVHLDLKGAPLKVAYLERVLIQAKAWGATGILLEWEDTFPYTVDLADVGSNGGCGGDGMYSIEEVQHLFQFAEQQGLEAIQLIQTMGHMEFVLKHPAFRDLRERATSPAALCPASEQAQALCRALLGQALAAQPGARYLHLGADEVWHTAECDACQRRARGEHGAAALFLEHVRDLATFVRQQRPGLQVLMWDDMLRPVSLQALAAHRLGELVQPVVWNYEPRETFRLEPALWDKYACVFPAVWAASAFKGASGSCQILTPVQRHVSNQQAWRREISGLGERLQVQGVVLTGWSRYEHYATLCELLPVALPSLAACLHTLATPEHHPPHTGAAAAPSPDEAASEVLPSDQWPGAELASSVHSFLELRARCLTFLDGDLVTTWLNPWQVARGYTDPARVALIVHAAELLAGELAVLRAALAQKLRAVTGARSADEWIHTHAAGWGRRLRAVRGAGARALAAPAALRPAPPDDDSYE